MMESLWATAEPVPTEADAGTEADAEAAGDDDEGVDTNLAPNSEVPPVEAPLASGAFAPNKEDPKFIEPLPPNGDANGDAEVDADGASPPLEAPGFDIALTAGIVAAPATGWNNDDDD
mmetsp:Transcript_81614/g.227290  ORF Transcript_81614/g.227290 Transcript_81614/m.227290 type:complete len:118 (-) Transcript_81614:69-422(-)